ncbi:hypothetical protein BD309DRAFT_872584 [Dichomitus squalens]|nr:hypothetical protein BD309DRAFT_872584 [Dichomitus squalens]
MILRLPSPPSADSDYIIRIASAVALAILYYDYILTFSAEVALFWKACFSLASFIFYLNRYLTLFSHLLVLYELYRVSDENLLSAAIQIIVAGLQFFRLYALYRGSRRVISTVFAIFIVLVIFADAEDAFKLHTREWNTWCGLRSHYNGGSSSFSFEGNFQI